jgi:hypothetical protein
MSNNNAAKGRTYLPSREDLASLIEQAVKTPAGVAGHPARVQQQVSHPRDISAEEQVPDRLIKELSAAQEHLRAEPSGPPAQGAPGPGGLTVVRAQGLLDMLRDFRSRYRALLGFVHRRLFDRRIEQLLFFKTTDPSTWLETGADGQIRFHYRGPIPEIVLGWALSVLPADLKRYAFVDFEAGNGRTLLLAARRNFEHAIGYTQDAGTCAMLEMNLAQYSRSYMSCRDVRALRSDRDSFPIPMQPSVLYFPCSMNAVYLSVALSRLSISLRDNPRPVYLIFENSGPERRLEQMELFRKVPLPILNRVKMQMFSPANVLVYKSLVDGGGN